MANQSKQLLLVTDTWEPQTNGVVTLLVQLVKALESVGIQTSVIHPGQFKCVSLPGYPEVQLAINPWYAKKLLANIESDYIHLATEGPISASARRYCLNHKLPFTTALHTKFPEYAKELYHIPVALGNSFLRWFHRPASASVVQSKGQQAELAQIGLMNLVVVGGGVDLEAFKPQTRPTRSKPILLYVGRVSKEKNIDSFLQIQTDATKVVVGDGPYRTTLEQTYPEVEFKGYKKGADLVREFAQADCLVFPSKSDTFGLVLIEAMACGTPVAAYPVTGPVDLVEHGVNGALSESLDEAIKIALTLDRSACRASVENYGWSRVGERFANFLAHSQI